MTGRWHGIPAETFSTLANSFGTPFYLFDADAVAARIRLVRESFDSLVKVYYAVKANPNLAMLRSVLRVADGLDISSGGELEQALLAGFEPARLSFAGPAKSMDEITASILRGVGIISVESIRELLECAAIARQHSTKASVALRINPQLQNRSFGIKMAGKPIQFGIDEESIGAALEVILGHSGHLSFRGIHVYAGSQCFDAPGIVSGVANTWRIASEIERSSGLTCETINVGGGFGVSHNKVDHELDIASVARDLVPLLRQIRSSDGARREVVFELGRYLTADAGIYVVRVISDKESRGKHFCAVDGGLHHHLAAAGTFGTALRSNYILQNLTRPDAPIARCNVAGPSCNPTDLLGVDIEIPKPEIGDLIGVEKSGSYGLTASPLLFLGRKTPAELVYSDGEIRLGRQVKTILDFN